MVVGAGSAGSTIAARLSENAEWNVLLIEAGEQAQVISEVPLLTVLEQFTIDNWNYTFEPQENACLGMKEGRCSLPRGKCLGGSSNLNYIIYTRGHRLNYDYWAELGNEGWSYEDVLPYFIKSEHTMAEDLSELTYRGTKGPLYNNWSYREEFGDAFIQAGVQNGYNFTYDCNSPEVLGFGYMQGNIRNGRRWDTHKAYIKPNLLRPNLYITTGSLATRVLTENNKAYGVEYVKDGITRVANANKEVIISAGSIQSPQLLMLSGIGPKEELEEFGISLVKDLPVGKLLYEHMMIANIIITTNATRDTNYAQELLVYATTRKGLFASTGGLTALAFMHTNSTLEGKVAPNLEILFSARDFSEMDAALPKAMFFRQELIDFFLPTKNLTTFTIIPIIVQPKSKGYLKLRSNNPQDPPLVYGNFFSDPKDLEDLLTATRISLSLLDTPAYQKFDAKLAPTRLPGCEDYEFNSDEYWTCVIKQSASTLYHPMSTCKMGPVNDKEAVVDNRLKVYGIESLRVADASVFPYAIATHTNAACIMVGEKVADMIKEDWFKEN